MRLWRYISIIVIVVITAFFGVSIYKSANNRQDKLSWFIERFKNERNIKFEHNNIYDYGIDCIFKDINKKCELSEKLYMVNNFQLKFNS